MRKWVYVSALTVVVIAGTARPYAQRRWFGGGVVDVPVDAPPAYDGRFVFARLKFTTGPGGYYFRGLPAWAHGYYAGGNRAEISLTKILSSITNMNPHVEGSRVVDVGSPDLFLYPVVYATEPGFLSLDEREARALHDYVLKGGFIIFDDFRGPADWENFRATMQRVLPGEQPQQLTLAHPIFHSFFDIQTLEFHQYYDRGTPYFYGYFPNNDDKKPMQVIANFNNDVSEYWEYSDSGFTPIDLSNEAYKLGVNYVIYSLTH